MAITREHLRAPTNANEHPRVDPRFIANEHLLRLRVTLSRNFPVRHALYSNRLEELEMQKLLQQRKREKAEEKEARLRVRAQIEADKAARRAKAAAESSQSVNTTSAPLSATSSSTSAHHRKDYTETRLHVLT